MIERPYRRIPEPERYCESCGERLHRKRWANGKLEAPKAFAVRRFCNHKCKGKSQEQPLHNLTDNRCRQRARKMIGKFCEHCGTTARLQAHHADLDPHNNDADNIATLCISCHALLHWRIRKSAFTYLAREAGLLGGRR